MRAGTKGGRTSEPVRVTDHRAWAGHARHDLVRERGRDPWQLTRHHNDQQNRHHEAEQPPPQGARDRRRRGRRASGTRLPSEACGRAPLARTWPPLAPLGQPAGCAVRPGRLGREDATAASRPGSPACRASRPGPTPAIWWPPTKHSTGLATHGSSSGTCPATATAASEAEATAGSRPVAVLPEYAVAHLHHAAPRLRVDDEDTTRPDHHVVDVGEPFARPPHVMEHEPVGHRQPDQRVRRLSLSVRAPLVGVRHAVEPLRLLSSLVRDLPSRFPCHHFSPRPSACRKG